MEIAKLPHTKLLIDILQKAPNEKQSNLKINAGKSK